MQGRENFAKFFNEFRALIFANFVQQKFLWKPYLEHAWKVEKELMINFHYLITIQHIFVKLYMQKGFKTNMFQAQKKCV